MFTVDSRNETFMLLPKVEFEEIQISRGYTHLGFGALRRVNGLGLVKLRFLDTLKDAVTQ